METLIKPVIIQIIVLSFQVITYFGIEYFEKGFHDVKRDIDDRIPEVPLTVFAYILWFPLVFIYPVTLYFFSYSGYMTYMIGIVLNIILSTVVYYVYPTTFTRPDSRSFLINTTRKMSYRMVNCVPSMHCSMSTMIMISCMVNPMIPKAARISFIITGAGIMLSTLTTKQHVVIDVITGIIFGIICYMLGFAIHNAVVV